ncbi:MAG TPA: class I SAM-dependent methyltransferase [Pseudonocardiaceae bacterium]
MTEQGRVAAAPWRDSTFANVWTRGDNHAQLLELPRAIAAALVAQDRPQVRTVLDIGSGPGDFLAVFLDEFPEARGIWLDASEAMLHLAKDRLAAYRDRVEYRLLDMTDLLGRDLPTDIDAIITSRAAHHLDAPGLTDFYGQAAQLLAPGGWLVNLDHVGPTEQAWDERLRHVRKRFQPPSNTPPHHHTYPLTSIDDHFRGLAAAGLTDAEIPWRAFVTCLFTARAA